jgi:hypothetical protein
LRIVTGHGWITSQGRLCWTYCSKVKVGQVFFFSKSDLLTNASALLCQCSIFSSNIRGSYNWFACGLCVKGLSVTHCKNCDFLQVMKGSPVGIVTDTGWTAGVRFLVEASDFVLLNTKRLNRTTAISIAYTSLITSRVLVRQRPIPTERPPLVGEVSANFSG